MSDKLDNIIGYPSLELIANQVVEGFITGLHKSPFHGFSVEFAEHRLYNVGESTKNIDWKLYARTDKLFVKRYEEETNLRALLVIDHSTSMYFPFDHYPSFKALNKIAFSVYACAALVHMLLRQRDAFGVSLISENIDQITEIKSNFGHKRHVFNILESLLRKGKGKLLQTNISPLIHQLAEQIHRRSLVIIFTDLFSPTFSQEEIISSLQHLRHCKHEVILFHVVDKNKEIELDFSNRPYHFIDSETSQQIKINPHDVRKDYEAFTKNAIDNIEKACGQMRVDFVEIDMNEGFDQVLVSYLIKRSKMN